MSGLFDESVSIHVNREILNDFHSTFGVCAYEMGLTKKV